MNDAGRMSNRCGIACRRDFHWTPFPGKLWQRNYCEHVIRSELELGEVRVYIADNSACRMLDRENPAVVQPDLSDG